MAYGEPPTAASDGETEIEAAIDSMARAISARKIPSRATGAEEERHWDRPTTSGEADAVFWRESGVEEEG